MQTKAITPLSWRKVRGALKLIPLSLLVASCCCSICQDSCETMASTPMEIQIGEEAFPALQQLAGGRLTAIPEIETYVRSVGNKLAAAAGQDEGSYEFVVLNDARPNAWALPEGKIAITRGLLHELSSEAELAAVLAHEVALSTAANTTVTGNQELLYQASQRLFTDEQKAQGVLLSESTMNAALMTTRHTETVALRADRFMIDTMTAAGYDPEAAVDLYEVFLRFAREKTPAWTENYFANHSPSRTRLEAIRQRVADIDSSELVTKEAEYFTAMDTLIGKSFAYDYLEEAKRLLAINEPDDAAKAAWKGIEFFGQEAQLWSVLGDAWDKLDNPERAFDCYDEAIQLDAGVYTTHLGRARQRVKLEQFNAAIADYNAANRLLNTAEAHYNLGNLFQAAGNLDAALAHYRVAATNQSTSGQRASLALARLELPVMPAAYLQLTPQLDANGFLQVKAHNISPVDVRDLEISVDLLDDVGIPIEGTRARYHQVIPRGTQAVKDTKLGPYKQLADIEPLLELRARSALLAE